MKYTFPHGDQSGVSVGLDVSDDYEAQVQANMDFHDDGGIDQDFDFIEDDIAACMTEFQRKEPVLTHVRQAIEKGRKKIPEQLQDTTVSEVQYLEESFQKVIGYSCK